MFNAMRGLELAVTLWLDLEPHFLEQLRQGNMGPFVVVTVLFKHGELPETSGALPSGGLVVAAAHRARGLFTVGPFGCRIQLITNTPLGPAR